MIPESSSPESRSSASQSSGSPDPDLQGSGSATPELSKLGPAAPGRAIADPVIETPRLVLRPFAPADAADLSRLAGDPRVARNLRVIGAPCPDLCAEGWILIQAGKRAAGTAYAFGARLDGALIGGGVLTRRPSGWELSYWLGFPYWDKGFGREIVRGLLGFATDRLGAARIVATCALDNPASSRVLELTGFSDTGEIVERFSVARAARYASRVFAYDPAAVTPAPRTGPE